MCAHRSWVCTHRSATSAVLRKSRHPGVRRECQLRADFVAKKVGCTCLDPFHPTSAPTRKRASISSRPASRTKRMRACSISARQLSRNHELTRTSAPLSSTATSIQADARSSLQPLRERNVRDSFFEGQHRIPSCFTSRTKHYDPARAETASVTSMWRQGKTGFWSVKLRPASARRAREDRRHSR